MKFREIRISFTIQNVFETIMPIYFFQAFQTFTDCKFYNMSSIENYFFKKISSVCTHVVWVTGDEDCSNNPIKSKGLKTQVVLNDTYWNRRSYKRLFGTKTLRVGVVIVSITLFKNT